MKKLIYILIFLLPVAVCAQQDGYQSSPLDYIWQNVGNAGFSAGKAYFINLVFSPAGQPYVAYQDSTNFKKATVMKFDGTNWVYVGTAGFSGGEAGFPSLAFSPSGEPYVAYQDFWYAQETTLKKFDGIDWVNVGNIGSSLSGG